MKVAVRLFARYREATGRECLEVDVPDGGTVEAAWAALAARHPELQAYRPYTLFAIGTEYVPAEALLRPGEELCCFPPISGGSDGFYRVTTEPLSEAELTAAVASPEAGGIVVFSGVVRNETGTRSVKFLEYEAHAPMAEAKMREIGVAVHGRWPSVRRVAMAHRIGRLEIGEASVIIAVSGAHRREAFEACHFAIDRLKEAVPIWKKESFEDGEVWVGSHSECDHRH